MQSISCAIFWTSFIPSWLLASLINNRNDLFSIWTTHRYTRQKWQERNYLRYQSISSYILLIRPILHHWTFSFSATWKGKCKDLNSILQRPFLLESKHNTREYARIFWRRFLNAGFRVSQNASIMKVSISPRTK
jgi:hypothetical protein